jgi:hypothetical protein
MADMQDSIGITDNNWYNQSKVSFVETSIFIGGICMYWIGVYSTTRAKRIGGEIYYEP